MYTCRDSKLSYNLNQSPKVRLFRRSTAPYSYNTIFPPFHQIPISDPHPLNSTRSCGIRLKVSSTCATIPLLPIGSIIHLDDILARGSDDAPCIKVHARHGTVVGEGVVDAAGPEVPYLLFVSTVMSWVMDYRSDLRVYCDPGYQ